MAWVQFQLQVGWWAKPFIFNLKRPCVYVPRTHRQRCHLCRRLPDSAIDIMDQAAARARLEAAAAAAAAAAAPAPATPATQPGPASGARAAAGTEAGKGSLLHGGGGWQRPPSGAGRSPDEERELLEWFGSTLAQRQRGTAGHSSSGSSSSAAGVSEPGAGPMPHRQQQPEQLQQQQQPVLPDASMLPCPHCGTPTPSKKGAITVVCSKCHACFLNLPPQQLMLGASLFLRKQQASHAPGANPAAAAKPAAGQEASATAGGAGSSPAEDPRPVVAAADVLAVVAEGAGVPLSHISRSDWESLLALETSLLQQVRRTGTGTLITLDTFKWVACCQGRHEHSQLVYGLGAGQLDRA